MPQDRQALHLLTTAASHLRAGDMAQAIAAFEASLAIDPHQPDAWFNLGWAQRALRQFDAALQSYARAIAEGDPHPEQALLNRATILSDHLFRPDAASVELEQALRANPGFLPAWLNLGNLHEDLGDPASARQAYDAVLARAPDNARAHARLAAIDVATGAAGSAIARLKAVVPQATDVTSRAELLFALGSALDAVGETADAFQAIEAANWIARSIAPHRYDAAAQERLVDALIAGYPVRGKTRTATVSTSPKTPVFICGMFRSGSTLAETILGRHREITPGGELETIPAIVQALRPYPAAALALSPDAIAQLRARYLADLPGDGWVTDKRCDNFLHIGLIKTLFPDARIIHTRRNAADTLLSTYFLHFGDGVVYGSDLLEAAHYYVQYARLMAHWRALYGADIIDLDYDTLVVDPHAAVSAALDALGLPWDAACLGEPNAPLAVRTASAWQIRRPIHRRSLHRWQGYRAQLGDAIALLERHGIGVTP
jgi:tetratricopeptide (TPR) repeat protein